MKLSSKNTENGKLYFGDKDIAYLKKVSRQSVEDHHNISILYFEIDWAKSKRNFYGELLIKKFVEPKGIPIIGAFKIIEGDETMYQGIPNKLLKLNASIFSEQLEEKNISPKIGDYFGIGKRLYLIYDKSINDAGIGTILLKRGRVRQDFFCIQDDDEVLQKDCFGDNLGLEIDIAPENIAP